MSTKTKIRWSWCDLYETVRNDLVYYDTGIWAAYFLGERDHHNKISRRLVDSIENGEKRAVVSFLLISETTHVIRKRVVQRWKGSDYALAMDSAMSTSCKFRDYVAGGLHSGRMILARSDGMRDHDHRVFLKASSVPSSAQNKTYKALGHADVEHAYLAGYGGASQFHTVDRSFRDLADDPDFGVAFVVHEAPADAQPP